MVLSLQIITSLSVGPMWSASRIQNEGGDLFNFTSVHCCCNCGLFSGELNMGFTVLMPLVAKD